MQGEGNSGLTYTKGRRLHQLLWWEDKKWRVNYQRKMIKFSNGSKEVLL